MSLVEALGALGQLADALVQPLGTTRELKLQPLQLGRPIGAVPLDGAPGVGDEVCRHRFCPSPSGVATRTGRFRLSVCRPAQRLDLGVRSSPSRLHIPLRPLPNRFCLGFGVAQSLSRVAERLRPDRSLLPVEDSYELQTKYQK